MRITTLIMATTAAVLSSVAVPIVASTQGPDVVATIPINPEREAYYGDLHLHTNFSFDAYLLSGTNVDPDAAYRFGRGEAVNSLGDVVRRSTPPLDFMAVTDHSENIGVLNTLDDPRSPLSQSEIGKELREQLWRVIVAKIDPFGSGGNLGVDVKATIQSAWQREIESANRNYQPGKFTTFIAYEWSSTPDGQNLHRNVIFRGNWAPNPFTALDSVRPEDLWSFLENVRKQGCEALAIPHNSNMSNGLMFDWVDSRGRLIDQAYAELRAANEPLVEVSQTKGQSETHPVLSPNDEFSNFEINDYLGVTEKKSTPGGGYVRDALGRGLVIAQSTGGANPYKYGIVGASDLHNGLSDSGENATAAATDATVYAMKKWVNFDKLLKEVGASGRSFYNVGSGNLTGIWSEQNTRESLFSALRRKETFATSGTRLKFRFFGGWDYDSELLKRKDWVRAAYIGGVPMGGDLPRKPEGKETPKFAIWAVKDPDGANLDRLQVVKVWLDNGRHLEKIYNVALSDGRKVDPVTGEAPPVGNTVDLQRATYTNAVGATELSVLWQDPLFDPTVPAVYYLRVLEIPTPRWSTISAISHGQPLPGGVSATVQERGWSSPIWFTPTRK